MNGHLEICSLIIGHIGVKKFGVDIQGTPLHMAAVVGCFKAFKLMMELLIEKNPANEIGETPFHLAANTIILTFANSSFQM